MYEMAVKGEIRTLGFKEGSSGIFTGAIEGLYQGYRFASTTPDRREFVLDAPNGSIALVLHQEISTTLLSRWPEHPFADGKDPLDSLPSTPPGMPPGGGPPPGRGPGGPPPGMPPGAGGPPPGAVAAGGPPPGVATAGGPPPDIFKKIHYMQVKLIVDPDKSTGIFAGATGEVELETPQYQMAGYLVINTQHGDLRLTFMEHGDRNVLRADLQVDGAGSSGIWQNARGDLKFELGRPKPMYGQGPYWGTIWLENPPPGT